jgi:hypothetical protein
MKTNLRDKILSFARQSPAYLEFLTFLERRSKRTKVSDVYGLRQYSEVQFEPDFPIGKFFYFLESLNLGNMIGRKFHWNPNSGIINTVLGSSPLSPSLVRKGGDHLESKNVYSIANAITKQSNQIGHLSFLTTKSINGNPSLLCIVGPSKFSSKQAATVEIELLREMLGKYEKAALLGIERNNKPEDSDI